MRCRKNFTELTADELNRLADALNHLQHHGMIEHHAHHHEQYFNNGIHRGPAFLPWHRHMILTFEQALRDFDATVTLPYWDWTRADSRDLDTGPWKSFFGGRNNTGGRFDHWSYNRAASPSGQLPTLDAVIDELRAASFADYRAMEFPPGSHVPGHTWTGGTMNSTQSPLDPLFYLHHCNVDRLWAIWQRNHTGVVQYTLDDCAGCPRVDATFVPLNDPMIGGATPASMLDHTALGYFYHGDDALEARVLERGFPPMVSGDVTAVSLETPQVIFNDVPEGETTQRAALFRVRGCAALSFEVTAPPAAPFSLFAPGPYPYPAGPLHTDELRIWVMYTAGSPGSFDAGTISVVARDEFGDEVGRWNNVPIFANAVARPRVAVTLVLDESGSMLSGAGNNRTRLQVLQLAATTFIDQLFEDNGLAMVSFAETADQLAGLQPAGPDGSQARNDARAQITSHGPPNNQPHTSIGSGLQKAADLYAAAPNAGDFDVRATVVFTDGFEDRNPLIAAVSPLINERVYAVGVADAANVRNDILRALANNTGGFMLVTGALTQDDEFLLEKFFIQVLAGVTNRDIVRDPPGVVVPGQIAAVPFFVTGSDIGFDAVALLRAPQYVVVGLRTPDGTVVQPNQVPAGAFRGGATTRGYRVTLPLVVNGVGHWEGQWELLLALGARGHTVAVLPAAAATFAAGFAIPFHAVIHARSNLHMRASVTQSASTPGATLFLRAVLTEYGQPLPTHPAVGAVMTRPDGTTAQLTLSETTPGEFETSVQATISGAYRFLFQAAGLSSRQQPFTREQLVTALVGDPAGSTTPGGGDGPDGPGGPGGGHDDSFCRLIKCLAGAGLFSEQFVRRLLELGIDLRVLEKCLGRVCSEDKPRDVIR